MEMRDRLLLQVTIGGDDGERETSLCCQNAREEALYERELGSEFECPSLQDACLAGKENKLSAESSPFNHHSTPLY
jgi:hypothetical protein